MSSPRMTARAPRRSLTPARAPARLLLLGIGLAVLVPLLALAAGCKKSERSKEDAPPVVECKPFCEKTFGTCGREVFIASGKLRVDLAMQFKVKGLLEKVKTEGLEKCLKGCEAEQGLFRDARGVNDCLKIADCAAFAGCITKYIK